MLSEKEWEAIMNISSNLLKKKSISSFGAYISEELFHLFRCSLVEFTESAPVKNKIPKLKNPIILSRYDDKFVEAFESQYESTYHVMDYINWIYFSERSLVYRESDLISESFRKSSKFFTQYLSPFGLIHAAGIILCIDHEFVASIALYNSRQRGDFSDKEMYILTQLLPLLQSSLEHILSINQEHRTTTAQDSSYLLKYKYHLTKREIEILGYIYKGMTNNEIAEILVITPNTVKKHLSNLFQKLEVTSRTQLLNFLVRNDLVNNFE